VHPYSPLDTQRRVEALAVRRHGVDVSHQVHSLNHPAKGGKTLPVRVALAAEIELGLVADTDKERLRRGLGCQAQRFNDFTEVNML